MRYGIQLSVSISTRNYFIFGIYDSYGTYFLREKRTSLANIDPNKEFHLYKTQYEKQNF